MSNLSFFYIRITALLALLPIFLQGVFVTPPSSSAGVVERPIEKEYEATEVPEDKQIPFLDTEEPEEQLELEDAEVVYVQQIIFQGNTTISSADLQQLIKNKIPAELTLRQIREICSLIKAKYVEKGFFLTRVFPPPQKIENGKLTIEIIEGKLGNISIEGNKYYKTSFIEGYFSKLQGKPINYDAFIRALLLLNENEDLNAGVIFKKGREFGTSDAIVRVIDKRPLHLYLNYNNYGSPLNSKYREGGRLDYGNFIFNGDKLSVIGVAGQPLDSLRFFDLVYSIFISEAWKTKMDLSYLYSTFKVSAFKPLHLSGRSDIAAVKFIQPHFRTRRLNTDGWIEFDYKQIQNFAEHETESFDKLREITLGYHVDYIDRWKGRNLFDFMYVQGIPTLLGGLHSVSSQCSRRGGGGLFSILRLNALRLQQLPANMSLYLNFNGQGSPYKLPLPEQFYIGGIDTVRGYPLASGLGDNGYFVNLEWRIPPFGIVDKKVPGMKRTWKEFLQFVYFIDQGQTFLNNNPNNETQYVHMISTGVGARISAPYHFDFSFDVGFPLSEQKKSSTAITYFKVTWRPF